MADYADDLIGDRAEYFRNYRKRIEARDKPVELAEGEEAEAAWSIVGTNAEVDPSTLSLSPRGYHKKLVQLGWDIQITSVDIHYADVLQMSDGKVKKDGSQVLKGEVRTPAHTDTTVFITSADKTRSVGLRASWTNGRFQSVLVRDPVGLPVEYYYDYTPRKAVIDTLGKDRAFARADKQNEAYNDGETHLENLKLMRTAGEFKDWLDDWMEQLIDGYERPQPKTKKAEPVVNLDALSEADLALINGGEWNG